jgi:site-specific recombinase XerC
MIGPMGMTRLESLKAIKDPTERAVTAAAYIKQHHTAATEAISVRDDAIRELLKSKGPTEVSRLSGLSLSHVKLIRSR